MCGLISGMAIHTVNFQIRCQVYKFKLHACTRVGYPATACYVVLCARACMCPMILRILEVGQVLANAQGPGHLLRLLLKALINLNKCRSILHALWHNNNIILYPTQSSDITTLNTIASSASALGAVHT
jgi:hypothetical protein